ncbi:GTPase, partial [Falsiroseomonas oryziterrae]|uniref:GTPase n=1 Tax=Falsiroseomonas oryziterrae TaxID=2911368 RepID=UPI001F013C9D
AELDARAAPDPAWREIERKAWEDVEALAAATPPLEPDREAATELARRTVETVARRFHPDDPDAAARVTLPELLLLTERVSRDLRRFVLMHMPGARSLRIDHALKVKRLVDRWGAPAQRVFEVGYAAWRIGRIAANPTTGVAQELARWLDAEGRAALAGNLRAAATRELVRETGRAAIDLYAGRLRLTAQEIETAEAADRKSAEAPADMPVRIAVLGQVNAGKSSTANAMAGAVLAETGPTPTPGGAREWEIRADGRPAVLLVDTPGLDGTEPIRAAALATAARADAIVWVAAATQPARAADVEALQALRALQAADHA